MNGDRSIRLFTHLIISLRMCHSLRCYLFNGSNQLLLISAGLNLTQWPTHSSQVCGTDPRALHPFPPPSFLGGYSDSPCSHMNLYMQESLGAFQTRDRNVSVVYIHSTVESNLLSIDSRCYQDHIMGLFLQM